jgi:phosphatidylinositol-3-phosphatase
MKTRGNQVLRHVAVGLASLFLIATGATTATAAPTPSRILSSPALPPIHLVVIFFENHSYGEIIDNPCCPYIDAQAAHGRQFTNYHAITHPSLPNYLAVSSGSTCSKTGTDSVTPYCPRRNLWNQLHHVGRSWRVFEESMPSRCRQTDTSYYAVRHNPEAIYADQRGTVICARHDMALPGSITSLPTFTFVTPNICHDMHDCTPAAGNAWLKTWLPKFLAVIGTRVLVTFDEGSTDNHVATFEVGEGVPIAVDSARYDHYSLLAGIEDAFGLNRLGNAAGAKPLPI